MSGRQAPRLGMGLASLIPNAHRTADVAPPAGPPRTIPVEMLEPSPFQPRGKVTSESVAELAASIRQSGVLQPLLVRPMAADPSRYEIVAGERRWRAAQAAGLHEVPALIRPLSDAEAMAAGLVENLQRTDLNAIEEGEGYQRLATEFQMTHDELARAVGKSRAHVGNTMRLLKLPPSVQSNVRDGLLSAGHARALLLHPQPEQAAASVIAKGLSVRQTEALAMERQTQPFGAERPEPAAHDGETISPSPPRQTSDMADLQQRLSAHLGLRVAIGWTGRKGRVTIDVEDLDQLEGVIRLLEGRTEPETRFDQLAAHGSR